jgi:hypothetical protein
LTNRVKASLELFGFQSGEQLDRIVVLVGHRLPRGFVHHIGNPTRPNAFGGDYRSNVLGAIFAAIAAADSLSNGLGGDVQLGRYLVIFVAGLFEPQNFFEKLWVRLFDVTLGLLPRNLLWQDGGLLPPDKIKHQQGRIGCADGAAAKYAAALAHHKDVRGALPGEERFKVLADRDEFGLGR